MSEDDVIAVWFSCGAASAVAAKLTLAKYGDQVGRIRVLNNPVAEEHPDNLRFLDDVQSWLGVEIERVVNSKYPSASAVDVWADRRFMSGINGAPCTLHLKKRARQEWEASNRCDWLVLGFTADEVGRADRFKTHERDTLLPVLIDAGMTKQNCFDYLQESGLRLPEMYHLGYPNANCIGCVKATSPTYWNHVRKVHPEVFGERARQSRELGAKLVRVDNKRIHLDQLDPSATGRPMNSMNVECGLFCDVGSSA